MSENEEPSELAVTDPEMRQLLGLFDVPAFARRGQELEFALDHLQARLRREREERLDMVRLRLRQWGSVATSPTDGLDLLDLAAPLEVLYDSASAGPPIWAATPGPPRRRLSFARDLAGSVERFNRRWAAFLDGLNLAPINSMIDNYNRYYLLEKECVFGSSRVAARNFRPIRHVTPERLRDDHPPLPAVSARR
jgi:hypothetical protein